MKTLAIIQARMSSSRLPGKVLLEMGGKPMLAQVIERVRRAQSVDSVLVATTTDSSDDPLAALCASLGAACFRGSLHDVLDRYYQAARPLQPEIIVRITADCPLIDPQVIDQTVALIIHHSAFNIPHSDFSCNRLPPPFGRTFPIGLDVEVCRFAALERAWKESTETFHREHVMPFLYEQVALSSPKLITDNRLLSTGISPRGFHIAQLHHRPDYGNLRWTVDTPEDLTFMREIFARLNGRPDFTWYDVLEIVQREPDLTQINAAVRHKTMTEVDERVNKETGRQADR
ncbi:MAG: glycosyltransferase family protein [Anaerolineales bacterium]